MVLLDIQNKIVEAPSLMFIGKNRHLTNNFNCGEC